MSEQLIQLTEDRERSEETGGETHSPLFFDDGMARIWIDLLTRATLYAGAIGLIVGIAAALLFRG